MSGTDHAAFVLKNRPLDVFVHVACRMMTGLNSFCMYTTSLLREFVQVLCKLIIG